MRSEPSSCLSEWWGHKPRRQERNPSPWSLWDLLPSTRVAIALFQSLPRRDPDSDVTKRVEGLYHTILIIMQYILLPTTYYAKGILFEFGVDLCVVVRAEVLPLLRIRAVSRWATAFSSLLPCCQTPQPQETELASLAGGDLLEALKQ